MARGHNHPHDLTLFVVSHYGKTSAAAAAAMANASGNWPDRLLTRNAVIGIWYRAVDAGLLVKLGPRVPKRPKRTGPSSEIRDRVVQKPKFNVALVQAHAHARAVAPELARPEKVTVRTSDWPAPPSKRLDILALRARHCRWVADDGTYCGHDQSRWGSSFCDHHAAIAHRVWPPERIAPRVPKATTLPTVAVQPEHIPDLVEMLA